MRENRFGDRLRRIPGTEKGFDYAFRYGKHAGETVEEVIKTHPGYCSWMQENKKMIFTKSVLEADRREIRQQAITRHDEVYDSFDFLMRHERNDIAFYNGDD